MKTKYPGRDLSKNQIPLKREIPVAPFERIFKNAGANRTGDDALVALRDAAEDYALTVAVESIIFAKHAGRKTIKADDVRLALK